MKLNSIVELYDLTMSDEISKEEAMLIIRELIWAIVERNEEDLILEQVNDILGLGEE